MDAERRLALRVLLTSIVVLLAGVATVRAFREAVFAAVPFSSRATINSQTRLREAKAELPSILPRNNVVLAIGASGTVQGIAPELVDKAFAGHGVTVESYNFGIDAMMPDIQRLLSARIRRDLEASGHKLKAVIIELSPEEATIHKGRGFFGWPSQKAILAGPGELVAIGRESPREAIRLVALDLLGYERPQVTTRLIDGALYETPNFWPTSLREPVDDSTDARANIVGKSILAKMESVYEGREWARSLRGERRLMNSATEADYRELLKLERSDDTLQEDLAFFKRCCDIVELHFDPHQIDQLIASVQDFDAIAEHTFVVLFPRDTATINYSKGAIERVREVKERIERETKTHIIDLMFAGTADDMFDLTHVNEIKGKPFVAQRLADAMSPHLQR